MPITINLPSATPSTPFTVTGTISGVTVAPSLVFSDTATLAVPAPTGVRATATATSVEVTFPAVTPTVTASDWTALPTGATVTTTGFSFTHPGVPVGARALGIAIATDKNVAALALYAVAVAESPDASTVFPPTYVTGSDGTKWSLSSAGQVTINGNVDGTSSNVVELYYQLSTHRVWCKNVGGLWYYKVKSTDAGWTYAATGPV
jgi:hypothetical protein